MSDGERDCAVLGVEVWKSSQKWSAQRSDVRSIAWLDALRSSLRFCGVRSLEPAFGDSTELALEGMWPRITGLGVNNTKDCVNWHAATWEWSHCL
jgi:hypothetical protein